MTKNIPLIIKASVGGFLLLIGPIFSMLMRNANANYILIITIGIIFEIFGIIAFYLYLRKDLMKEEELVPVKKGKKGRNAENL